MNAATGTAQRRIRVLYVIDVLTEDGGAERIATGLATHLPPERFDVWICSTRSSQPSVLTSLDDAGVRHIDLARSHRFQLHRLLPLISLIRRERFDVVHAHKFGSNVWATVIARACGVPVVLAHDHTWSYVGDPIRRWLDGRVIGRLATRFIAVSALDAERMVTIEHVPPEKVVLIPNGYVPRPSAAGGDLRRELGIDEDVPLVACVAVLRPQKALSVLLQAHARVLQALPEARLAIAGEGPERDRLEMEARQLGIEHRTHFLGYRADVDAILADSDVAAMSSDFEGTPVVSFECMANGIPLVATAVGGLPQVIEDGRTGLLVPPREPGELAEALLTLLKDRDLRRAMGAAAQARLPEFTIEASVRQLTALYESLVTESAAA